MERYKKFEKRFLNFINRNFIGPLMRKLYKISGIKNEYKVLNINSEAIGHYCLDVALFLIEKKLNRSKFRGVLLSPRGRVANEALSKLWSKYSALVVIENRFLCFLLEYLKYYDDTNYDCSSYSAVHGRNPKTHELFYSVNNETPLISWDQELLRKAHVIFKIKFPNVDQRRVIILHSRDSLFDKKTGNPNLTNQNHRNSQLESYKEIINYLNKLGYFVFRIGTYENDDNTFDIKYYKFCNLDSFEKELLEIYATSMCKLFLGSPSGPLNLAIIWRRPLFALNMLPYGELRQAPINSMVVPKLLKKNGKLLTIKEVFNNNYHLLNRDDDYLKHGIEWVPNSSNEIMDDFMDFFQAFVKSDQVAISNLVNSREQKLYKNLSNSDSYDYNAIGLISKHYLLKNKVL